MQFYSKDRKKKLVFQIADEIVQTLQLQLFISFHNIFRPDNDYERRLPRDKLYLMCKYEPVQNYVRKSDYMFYQALVEVLIPDVLRPIPSKSWYHCRVNLQNGYIGFPFPQKYAFLTPNFLLEPLNLSRLSF